PSSRVTYHGEGPSRPTEAKRARRCFNGAVPRRERRHFVAGPVASAMSQLQWGRSSSGTETRAGSRCGSASEPCFNGAVPRRERIRCPRSWPVRQPLAAAKLLNDSLVFKRFGDDERPLTRPRHFTARSEETTTRRPS